MIIPPRENFEKIFRLYRNKCSFWECSKTIIDSDNHINGIILFAESNLKGNPRFNSNLSNNDVISYKNLILFCDMHCWEVENDPEKYTGARLKSKIEEDLKKYPDSNFELTDERYDEFLYHFIIYHDPKRFSHIRTYIPLFDEAADEGTTFFLDMITCDSNYIKPTKQLVGGKFEIIDSKRKLEKSDIVIFYPATKDISKGIHVEIEFKSSMRIEGKVPEIPKGQYLIAVISSNQISRLEHDLEFEIL